MDNTANNTAVTAGPAVSSIADLSTKYAELLANTGKATKSYQDWANFSADVKFVAESTKKTQKEVLQAVCPVDTPFESFHATVRALISRAKKALMSTEDKAKSDKKKADKATAKAEAEAEAEAKAKALADKLQTYDGKMNAIASLIDSMTSAEDVTNCGKAVKGLVTERLKALTLLKKTEELQADVEAGKAVIADAVAV